MAFDVHSHDDPFPPPPSQLRAAFDSNGRLRSIWHEDKACAAAAAACTSEVTAKLLKLLPSLTTITLSVASEAATVLAAVPPELKASYAPPTGANPAQEQQQQQVCLALCCPCPCPCPCPYPCCVLPMRCCAIAPLQHGHVTFFLSLSESAPEPRGEAAA